MSGGDRREGSTTTLQRLGAFYYEHGIWIKCLAVLIVLAPIVLWTLQHATHKYCYMPPATHREYMEALQFLASVAKKMNLTVFLEYGTLLGAMRCRDLLPWSWEDMDIGMIISDPTIVADELQREFQLDGRWNLTLTNSWKWHKTWSAFFTIFPVNAPWDDLLWSYYNHMHHDYISIDIYVWHSWHDRKFKQMGTRYQIEVDEEFFAQPLAECTLSHVTFNCPHRAREYLEMEYEPGVIENIVADRVCWTDWLRLGYYASVFLLGCATILLGLVSCTPDNLRDIIQLRLGTQKPKDLNL